MKLDKVFVVNANPFAGKRQQTIYRNLVIGPGS